MQTAITIIVGMLSFGAIILVHELGHFIFAIKSNVHVSKFGIGMGPCIYKKIKNRIEYCICVFPVGGYVQMPENQNTVPEGKIVFADAPFASKAAILMAGSAFNIISGFILILLVSLAITTAPTTTVSHVGPEVVFDEASRILPGDTIVKVDNARIDTYMDFMQEVAMLNKSHDVVVERNDAEITLTNIRFGVPLEENTKPSSYGIFFYSKSLTIPERLESGVETFRTISVIFFDAIVAIFSGEYQLNELTGPVGITKMIGDSIFVSFTTYGMLIALLAINIGGINLLPFPALDGSRVLIASIEALIHRSIPPKVHEFIHNTGFFFLIGLIILITYNDISSLLS